MKITTWKRRGNKRPFWDAEIYIKRKVVQKEDEMTNLCECNFYGKQQIKFISIEWKMDVRVPFSFLVKNKNDGRYTDHLVIVGLRVGQVRSGQFVRCEQALNSVTSHAIWFAGELRGRSAILLVKFWKSLINWEIGWKSVSYGIRILERGVSVWNYATVVISSCGSVSVGLWQQQSEYCFRFQISSTLCAL